MKQDLILEIEEKLSKKKVKNEIPEHFKSQIDILFSDSNVRKMCERIITKDYVSNINYSQLKEIEEVITIVRDKVSQVSEEVDIYLFLKEGYKLDYEGLVNEFKKKNLSKQFPNIDLKYLTDNYEKPPRYISPYYDDSLKVIVNKTVYRKFLISILQMVFNEMDLLCVYTGAEGVGKSSLASQHILMVHRILTESKIIEYKYKINEIMFNSLSNLRNAEDEHFSEKFRLFALDEGNELHRQNWKDEEVQTFFQRLRRERFNQRIKFICIPVLGELMMNIIMARVNFIFEAQSKNKAKMGILDKGDCNFYIIPRGNRIYSYEHRRNIDKDYIKQVLYENLKDKSYLKGMPSELIIQKFRFNGVFGFRKQDYIRELKESNKSFSVKEGIKLGNTTLYILYRLINNKMLKPKTMGLKSGMPEYASFDKFVQNIRKYFVDNQRAFRNEEEKYKLKYSESSE